MALVRAGGKRHRIQDLRGGIYLLSWEYEVKYSGSRLLFHRKMTRETDRKGAEKFSKKWGCPMPTETKP